MNSGTNPRWYKSGWDDERKARQREAIHRWKPWEKSTGPKTDAGKAQAALNGRYAWIDRLSGKQLLAFIRRF